MRRLASVALRTQILLLAAPLVGFGFELPVTRSAIEAVVREDVSRILARAGLPQGSLGFEVETKPAGPHQVTVECTEKSTVSLTVRATDEEWGPALYLGLRKLGFLFPHPRIQISPAESGLREHCGAVFTWTPRVRYRGFHMHTAHPSEWVSGFLGPHRGIRDDTLRWLARNGQNVVELRLLRTAYPEAVPAVQESIELAHGLGMHFGLAVSFARIQQKSFHLIPPLRAITGIGDARRLQERLRELMGLFEFDFININLGTTEFTTTDFDRTLEWIDQANTLLSANQRQLFNTVHVSTGMEDERYGNFYFLPQHSDHRVGIFAHTVMFYGLRDQTAPVYGRTDFEDTRSLLERERRKRPVWYYPETSYFIAMDIDVPLLLTDYMVSRADDYDYVSSLGLPGHITFTTGQELGYWLIDWTVALLADSSFLGNPMAAIELLGEDPAVWRRIIDFQTKHIKRGQLIRSISSTTVLDEVPSFWHEKVHARSLLRGMADSRAALSEDLARFERVFEEMPPLDGVRNEELRLLLGVTWDRIRHAYFLRKALEFCGSCEQRAGWVRRAAAVRKKSLDTMRAVVEGYNRYPAAKLFEEHSNPTSYDFGYGWTARTLHFWEREERMVAESRWFPLFKNVFDLWHTLF